MGLRYETPAPRVVADPSTEREVAALIQSRLGFRPKPLIGVHVSARRASQRWPGERFIELLERLPAEPGGGFVLLWAPGPEGRVQHPGDDEKAARIAERLQGFPLVPVATSRLEKLIAALSLCDHVICADGGAMHLAAALGRPIVCLFGDSDATRWRPWCTRYELLQPSSRNVADIAVADVVRAYQRLRVRLAA
jgi:ADP-heptose:LPS heptosyltransferase